MKNHTCIKPSCGREYEEEDDEAYYCFDCRKENQETAKRIDSQRRSSRRRVGGFKEFEQNSVNMKGMLLMKVSI